MMQKKNIMITTLGLQATKILIFVTIIFQTYLQSAVWRDRS